MTMQAETAVNCKGSGQLAFGSGGRYQAAMGRGDWRTRCYETQKEKVTYRREGLQVQVHKHQI
jgi:hypothetical protein